jgi:hypothetical protein
LNTVVRVGRRHEEDIQREPDLVATDLNGARLEHVEQPDLNPLGQVREYVDAKMRGLVRGTSP